LLVRAAASITIAGAGAGKGPDRGHQPDLIPQPDLTPPGFRDVIQRTSRAAGVIQGTSRGAKARYLWVWGGKKEDLAMTQTSDLGFVAFAIAFTLVTVTLLHGWPA
jgi:hypothetical protein